MKNNQKFLSGLLLGAAVGAVAAVFLQGEKGQELLSTAKKGIKDAASDLKNGIENIDNTFENWISKGRNLIAELKNKTNSEDIDDYEEIFS
ncbi:MAG: YtxH domain-containing protein [Arachidicoccus sp.]|nr:YtxH domain-containing protein [Arachidicoccus sp.]